MAKDDKKKKIMAILTRFYNKMDKIEAEKQRLVANIQAGQDQDKIKQAQEKLKSL